MERLTVLALLATLVSCAADGPGSFDPRFSQSVTALLISNYQEDPVTHRFLRSTAWGQIPEKLIPDGMGGYSAAVPLLLQSETSEGPQPDQFWTVLVRVIRSGESFSLAPNEALPGEYQVWHDDGRRTVWFRGKSWQFQGRY